MSEKQSRTQPHDIAAEQSFLGALLIDPDAIYQVMSRTRSEVFYHFCHADIYTAYRALFEAKTPINLITLADELRKQEKLDGIGIGDLTGTPYLAHLVDMCPTSLQIGSYLDIVLRTFRLRRAITGAARIVAEAIKEGADPDVVEATALELWSTISGEALAKVQSAKQATEEVYDELSERIQHPEKFASWKSPWTNLTGNGNDRKGTWRGLRRKTLNFVAARPGMGKSAVIIQWAHWLAQQGVPQAIFSLEMTQYEIILREVGRRTETPIDILLEAEIPEPKIADVIQTLGDISDLPIFYDETPALSLATLGARIRPLVMAHGVKVVWVDYLQLLAGDGNSRDNRAREVGKLSRGLKVLAKDLDIAIVATAQLNRAVERRDNKRPILADLRDSGELEQDADTIMFLYRDDYYDTNSDQPNVTEFIKAKDRNGRAPATAFLYWKGATTSFVDVEMRKLEDEPPNPDWGD